MLCWVAHYGKRLFETFFVHRFSRPTMPLTNLFKNCGYYWTFTALVRIPSCVPSPVSLSTPYAVHSCRSRTSCAAPLTCRRQILRCTLAWPFLSLPRS